MPFDAVTVCCVADELNSALESGRIDKIYMPAHTDIVMNVRAHGENKKLLISCNPSFPRVHFTSAARENPPVPTGFCMLLRKYLTNAKILSVTSPEGERSIFFTLECRNELGDTVNKKLIAELYGKNSNIILLHETGLIADCVRHIDNSLSRERIILPGLPYFPPTPQNKLFLSGVTLGDVKKLVEKCDPTKKADTFILENFAGLSPLVCREIVYLWGADTDLTVGAKEGLADAIYFYINKLKEKKFTPVTVWDKSGKPTDFSCIDIRQYAGAMLTKKAERLTEALDEFYGEKERKNTLRDKGGALLKTVETILARGWRKAAIQEESILSADGCEKYKVMGDLIFSNIYRIKKGDRSLVCENFYADSEEVTVALDENLTPSENAQRYYKKYNKLKSTAEKAKEQYERSLEDIRYLESVQTALSQCETVAEIEEIREELESLGYVKAPRQKGKKKTASPLGPSKFVSPEGFTVYVGKNNRQNDYLTLKMASSRDIWFHTKGFPGSHTILETGGAEVPPSALTFAACLAAYYSKARGSAQIAVDYCPVKNVKKPSGAKPGMVIYDSYNTAYVTPDEEMIKNLKHF